MTWQLNKDSFMVSHNISSYDQRRSAENSLSLEHKFS